MAAQGTSGAAAAETPGGVPREEAALAAEGAGGDAGAAAGDACGPERDMGGAAEGTDAEAEAAAAEAEAAAAAAAAGAAEQQQHQPLRRRAGGD